MAKPRVFISSTYYDLKHIRASLDLFVDSLGYEPVLSEKGDIAYTHDRPLDESCYREAENSDIFVLIIGGRYGSEASGAKSKHGKEFFDRYDSITKKEYESAIGKDIPLYVLIEKGVYSEYQTFLRNKDHKDITYAHVESVNVFLLIEDILAKPRNNPIHAFEKFEEIEAWLREQWAGFFRELLRRQSQQQQLVGLTTQVGELKAVNETLKKYLEAVMLGVDKDETSKLIESEEQRLNDIRRVEAAKANDWVRYVARRFDLEPVETIRAVISATSRQDFVDKILRASPRNESAGSLSETLRGSAEARRDLNDARAIFDLSRFPDEPTDFAKGELTPRPAASPSIPDWLKVGAGSDMPTLSQLLVGSARSVATKPATPLTKAEPKPRSATKKVVAKKVATKKAPAKSAPRKRADS